MFKVLTESELVRSETTQTGSKEQTAGPSYRQQFHLEVLGAERVINAFEPGENSPAGNFALAVQFGMQIIHLIIRRREYPAFPRGAKETLQVFPFSIKRQDDHGRLTCNEVGNNK